MDKRDLVYKTAIMLAEEFRDKLTEKHVLNFSSLIIPFKSNTQCRAQVEITLQDKINAEEEMELYEELREFIKEMNLEEAAPGLFYNNGVANTKLSFKVVDSDVIRNLGIKENE